MTSINSITRLNRIMKVVFLLVAYLISASVFAGPKITIYTEEFPPYNFMQNGVVSGINVDIVRIICESAKIECTFQLLPWNRAFNLTQENSHSGLMSTSRNEKREHLFQWVGPLVSSTAFFYQLASRDKIHIQKNEELLNYTVGIPRNDIYESVLLELGFEKNKNLLEFSYKQQMTQLFLQQKLDLIIGSDLTLAHQMSHYGLKASAVSPVVKLPINNLQGNFLALNLKAPKPIKLLLQKSLDELKAKQGLQHIIERYKAVTN